MCPNVNHPDYKKLVEDLEKDHPQQGEEYAHLAWIRHGETESIPTTEEANKLLSQKFRSSNSPISSTSSSHGEVGEALKSLVSEKGKTIADALKTISENDSEYSDLAKTLLEAKAKGLDAGLEVKKKNDLTSTYDPVEHNISISKNHTNNPQHYMHEATHAMTSRELQSQFNEAIGKSHPVTADDVAKVLRSDKVTPPVKDLVHLFLKVKEELGKDKSYGLTDIHEFIAEAFTNSDFQEKLNGIKGIEGKSLWQEFVQAIKSILGISAKPGSALSETLRAAIEVATGEHSEAYNKYFESRGNGDFQSSNAPKSETDIRDEFTRHLGEEDYKATKEFIDSLSPQDRQSLKDSLGGRDPVDFAHQHFDSLGEDVHNNNISQDENGIPLAGNIDDAVNARREGLKVVKDQIDDLNKLRKGGSNYQPLVNKETSIASTFKAIDYHFLSNEDLATYSSLLNNFTETRSKSDEPSLGRVDVNELESQLADLYKKANQGKYDYMSQQPESAGAFEGRTFDEFGNDIDVANQHLQDWLNSGAADIDSGSQEKSQIRLDTEDAIREMQQELQESGRTQEVKDTIYSYVNVLKNYDQHIGMETPEMKSFLAQDVRIQNAVRGFVDLVKEHGEDSGKIIDEIFKYALESDPSEMTNLSDVLKLKYLIQAFRTDGYFPFVNTFVSNGIKEIIHQEGIPFQDGYNKRGGFFDKFAKNFYGIQAQQDRVAATAKASHFVTKLKTPLLSAYSRAKRADLEFLTPITKAIQEKYHKQLGRQFTEAERNQMGILATMRQRYTDEMPNEAIQKNAKWNEDSANNHIGSNDPLLAKAAKDHLEFLNLLTKDLDFQSADDQRPAMEATFVKAVNPEALAYIKDMQKIFEVQTPLARVTSEFAYGKEFHEIENYFPSFSIYTGGQFEDLNSAAYNKEASLRTSVDDFAVGNKGTTSISASRKGLSSIKERMRVVRDGTRLVLNINNMIINRGRLNLLDHFTAFRRRELDNVIKSKQFSIWLGDTEKVGDKVLYNQKGRADMLKRAFTQEWISKIQANSTMGTFQSVMNGFTRRFSVAKLASLYRAPVHILGNLSSYFVKNPEKMWDTMKAYAAMLEAHRNTQYRAFLDRLFFESNNRGGAQEILGPTFDRSTNIRLTDQSHIGKMMEDIGNTPAFQGIAKLDEGLQKVLFAPLKWSDVSSGNAIMLTEYLHNERERLGNPHLQFKDLVLNADSQISYHKSLAEMERHVSITDASRRGLWMNNQNASISLLRNLTMAFAGKKMMNATNFGVAIYNLLHGNLTAQDKATTVRFMAGIAAQTAMFQFVKWTIQGMTGNAILSAVKNNTDDSIEQLYRKQLDSGSLSPRQKVMLEQEISTRRHIRAALRNAEDKSFNVKSLVLDTTKDMLPNMILPVSLLQSGYDGIIHMTYDAHETATFEQMKQGELDRLAEVAKRAKENGNVGLYTQARAQASDLESQRAFQLINQHQDFQSLGGIIGEFLNQNGKFGAQAINSVMTTKELYPSDIVSLTSAFGIGQPELEKYLRLQKAITEPKDQAQPKLEQKIQKLQKAGTNY